MDEKSLSHTSWNCKYHIVLVPKYRRKVIYGKLRKDIGKILRHTNATQLFTIRVICHIFIVIDPYSVLLTLPYHKSARSEEHTSELQSR